MFKLKGKIRIVVTNTVTGEARSLYYENTIMDWVYRDSAWFAPMRFPSFSRISVSTNTQPVNEYSPTLTNIVATTYVPSGQLQRRWFEQYEPIFGEIYGRIDFTGTERTFNTIALTDAQSSNTQTNISATMYAGVLMDVPCVQGAFDILDIFYRIEIITDDSVGFAITPEWLEKEFGRQVFQFYYQDPNDLGQRIYEFALNEQTNYPTLAPNSQFKYNRLLYPGSVRSTAWDIYFNSWGGQTQTWNFVQHKWLYKHRQFMEFGLNDPGSGVIYNGKLFTSISVAGHTLESFIQNQGKRIQNTWSHSSSATTYFFDSLKLASGTGKVIPSELTPWSGSIAKMYRYNIKTGGDGNATYTISRRSHFGFNGLTFTDLQAPCPYTWRASDDFYNHPGSQPASAIPGGHYTLESNRRTSNPDMHFIGNNTILAYNETGITRLNLFTGEYKNYDLQNGGLVVTDLRQIAYAVDGTIYAACRNNGLWSIDPVTGIATQRITQKCYGVDIGFGGKVWAIWEGGISNSDNFAATFPITDPITTNWSAVNYLRCDRASNPQRIALMASGRLLWYTSSTGSVVVASIDYGAINHNPAQTAITSTGVFLITFIPDTRTVDIYDFGAANPRVRHSGSQGRSKLFMVGDLFYIRNFLENQPLRLVNTNGVVIETGFNDITEDSVLLEDNMTFSPIRSNFLAIFPHDHRRCWTEYGWDGTQWVTGNSTAKQVHTNVQPTIDGLGVRFTIPSTNGSSFVAGDWYSHSCNHGVLKDNATTLYHEYSYYSKPIVKYSVNLTVPNAPTVPPACRYWRIRNFYGGRADGGQFQVRNLQFFDRSDAPISNLGSIAIASSTTANASQAFDASNNNTWSATSRQNYDEWIGLQLASDAIVGRVAITLRCSANTSVVSYLLEYSTNGIDWQLASGFNLVSPADGTQYTRSFPYASAIVPIGISDPEFLFVDAESAAASSLQLNNQVPATLYLDGYGSVGINEIALMTPGYFVANVANAGQTISGSITYVQAH